jgi:hypothetical protein
VNNGPCTQATPSGATIPPDGTVSDIANLTRVKDALRDLAEPVIMKHWRKIKCCLMLTIWKAPTFPQSPYAARFMATVSPRSTASFK